MLREQGLLGPLDKVAESVQFLKDHEPPEGYYLAFSGGKDSICIKEIADMAGVKYDAHMSVTTIDPPELIYFVRKNYPDVHWEHPEIPFLRRLEVKGFPQRHRRWCCEEYKERGGSGRRVVTGIRAAESAKRAGRRAVETCYKDNSKTYFNAIIGWSDDDVWEFIEERKLEYCSLYDEGFHRLGCLLCPMATKWRVIEAKRYPRMVKAFIRSFEKLYENKKANPKPDGTCSVDRWANGEEMFWWWLGENRMSEDPDQTVLFE